MVVFPPPPLIAETEHLLLRELTADDADALLALYRQPAVAAVLGPPPATVEDERAAILAHRAEYYDRHGVGLWAVEMKKTSTFVGRAGLLSRSIDGVPEVEVSYVLDPRFWGRGLATEMAHAAVSVARHRLGAKRIIALIQPANARSIRVAERLGLALERDVELPDVGSVGLYAGAVDEILRNDDDG